MGAKFIAIGSLVIIGWMLADALLHPTGVAALGTASEGILSTVGNQVTGVSTNTNAKVLGG